MEKRRIRSLHIARKSKADIVALTVAEVARRQTQIGHVRLPPACTAHDMRLARVRSERVDAHARRIDAHRVVIMRPFGGVAADVVQPEHVRREFTDRRSGDLTDLMYVG